MQTKVGIEGLRDLIRQETEQRVPGIARIVEVRGSMVDVRIAGGSHKWRGLAASSTDVVGAFIPIRWEKGRPVRGETPSLTAATSTPTTISVSSPGGGGGNSFSDHGQLTGLGDDDHAQYLHVATPRTVTAQHTFVATTPFTVTGTGLVTNLNADRVDGYHASVTSTASTIPVAGGTGKLAKAWVSEVLSLADLSGVTGSTGSGTTVVLSSSPTLTTPVIGSFVSATHTHQNAAGGGKLDHGLALTGLGDDDHPQYAAHAQQETISGSWDFEQDTVFDGDIGRSTYVSQLAGWQVTSAGHADFRTMYADELHVQAFIADVERALAGAQIISKSLAILNRSFIVPAVGNDEWLYVQDLPGLEGVPMFEVGDTLGIKVIDRSGGGLAIATVYLIVKNPPAPPATEAGEQVFYVGRTNDPYTISPDGKTVSAGSVVLDFGVSGDGYWHVTTLDPTSGPYAEVVTWSTNPSNRNVKVRLGDLAGIAEAGNGYGLYAADEANAGLVYVKGSLYALSGELHDLDILGSLEVKAGAKMFAGVEAGERIEINETGLYSYNATSEEQVRIDATTGKLVAGGISGGGLTPLTELDGDGLHLTNSYINLSDALGPGAGTIGVRYWTDNATYAYQTVSLVSERSDIQYVVSEQADRHIFYVGDSTGDPSFGLATPLVVSHGTVTVHGDLEAQRLDDMQTQIDGLQSGSGMIVHDLNGGYHTGTLLVANGGTGSTTAAGARVQLDVPSIADLSAHTGNTTNPHNVTAAQVGSPTNASFSAHTGNTSNPHSVTAAQVGAPTNASFSAHTGNTTNPHNVTAAQVGAAPTTRTLTAGNGLSGGGTLAANLTFTVNVAASGAIEIASDALQVKLPVTSGLSRDATGLYLADTVAGNGLGIASKVLSVNVVATGAIEIASDALQVKLPATSGLSRDATGLFLADSVAGDGLGISGKVLSVNTGTGLEIVSDSVRHATGNFGDVHTNYTENDANETVTGSWTFDNTNTYFRNDSNGIDVNLTSGDGVDSRYGYITYRDNLVLRWRVGKSSTNDYAIYRYDATGSYLDNPLLVREDGSRITISHPLDYSEAYTNTKVTNLNADLLDGFHESAFGKLADNETVTGSWTFDNPLTVSSGKIQADVVDAISAIYLEGTTTLSVDGPNDLLFGEEWGTVFISPDITRARFSGYAGQPAPFTIIGGAVNVHVPGLNADLLDGYHESSFAKLADDEVITGLWQYNEHVNIDEHSIRLQRGPAGVGGWARGIEIHYSDDFSNRVGGIGFLGGDSGLNYAYVNLSSTPWNSNGQTGVFVTSTGVGIAEEAPSTNFHVNGDSLFEGTATFDQQAVLLGGSLSSGSLSVTGNEAHDIGAAANRWRDVYAGGADLSGTITAQGIDISAGGTIHGDLLMASSNIRIEDHNDHAHLVINPRASWMLDEQFGLDVDDNLLVRGWIVGKHAIQLDDAVMICHFDGREGDYTGEPNGHMGQVPIVDSNTRYVPGKFGKALRVGSTATNKVPNPIFMYDAVDSTTVTGVYSNSSNDGPLIIVDDFEGPFGPQTLRLDPDSAALSWVGADAASHFTLADGESVNLVTWIYSGDNSSYDIKLWDFATNTTLNGTPFGTIFDEGWNRLEVSYTNNTGNSFTGVGLLVYNRSPQYGTSQPIWIGGAQILNSDVAQDLFHGDMPGASWTGTPHNSESTQTASTLIYEMEPSDDFSIGFWRKDGGYSLQGNSVGQPIEWIPAAGGATDRILLGYRNSNDVDGTRRIWARVGGTAATIDGHVLTEEETLSWMHYVLTGRVSGGNTTLTIYVNGVELASHTFTGRTWTTRPNNLKIKGGANCTNVDIDDLFILEREMPADEVRAVYESNAPVFAETSTWQWRAGKNLVWADETGLYAIDDGGNPVMGVIGADTTWGGKSLVRGDVLLGNGSSYLHWQRATQTLELSGEGVVRGAGSDNPSIAGLYLQGDRIGFHDGTSWKSYLTDTGTMRLGSRFDYDGTSLRLGDINEVARSLYVDAGTIQVRDGANQRFAVDANSLYMKDIGGTQRVKIAASGNVELGNTSSENVLITPSLLALRDGTTNRLLLDATGVSLYNPIAVEQVRIDNSALRMGELARRHIKIDTTSIKFYDAATDRGEITGTSVRLGSTGGSQLLADTSGVVLVDAAGVSKGRFTSTYSRFGADSGEPRLDIASGILFGYNNAGVSTFKLFGSDGTLYLGNNSVTSGSWSLLAPHGQYIYRNTGGVGKIVSQWTASGVVLGANDGSEPHVVINPTSISLRAANGVEKIGLNGATGDATFTGDITALTGTLHDLSLSGDLTIGTGGAIHSASATASNTGPGFWLDYDGTNTTFRVGDLSSHYLYYDGDYIQIDTGNFALVDGDIVANNVDLAGTITATAGGVGGWAIASGAISASNMTLQSGSNAHILAGTGTNAGGINSPALATSTIFWAGESWAGKVNAPFRVKANGEMIASNATIAGDITANTGALVDLDISGTLSLLISGEIEAGPVKLTSTGLLVGDVSGQDEAVEFEYGGLATARVSMRNRAFQGGDIFAVEKLAITDRDSWLDVKAYADGVSASAISTLGAYSTSSGNPQAEVIAFASHGSSSISLRADSVWVDAPLDVATILTEAVQRPTLLNSWTNYGTFEDAGYYKDPMGRVHLMGVIEDGTSGTTIFTLPTGYRPSKDRIFKCLTYVALGNTYGVGRIDIDTSGNVSLNAGSPDWISLEGISFNV